MTKTKILTVVLCSLLVLFGAKTLVMALDYHAEDRNDSESIGPIRFDRTVDVRINDSDGSEQWTSMSYTAFNSDETSDYYVFFSYAKDCETDAAYNKKSNISKWVKIAPGKTVDLGMIFFKKDHLGLGCDPTPEFEVRSAAEMNQ